MAILEALNLYNLSGGVAVDENIEDTELDYENEEDQVPPINVEDDNGTDVKKKEIEGAAPCKEVVPRHYTSVSALTNLEFESPKTEHGHTKGGESIFEDSAWSDEYDAQGRIDGTLAEEQDTQIVADIARAIAPPPPPPPPSNNRSPLSGVKDIKPKNQSATSKKPPLISRVVSGSKDNKQKDLAKKPPLVSRIRSVGSKDSSSEKKDNLDDDSVLRIAKMNEKEASKTTVPKDPTASTGLRHRRNVTRVDQNNIAAKTMAEELAQIAALHGGDVKESTHRRKKTVMTGAGEIDNLLHGVDILAQQEDALKEKGQHTTANINPDDNDDDKNSEDNEPHDEETGEANEKPNQSTTTTRRHFGKRSEMLYQFDIWYHDLIRPKIPSFVSSTKRTLGFVILPLLIVALILFYLAGNPMVGAAGLLTEEFDPFIHASWSWWVLFFLRQSFVLSCVKAGEVISIDILALRTPLFLKVFGSFATLMIVQARGWPYVLTFWSLSDFCFLYGKYQFPRHWLFWQTTLDIFNENNPAGNFLHSNIYREYFYFS